MKTITFNRNRGNLLTSALVLSGLVAFYYYRRQGGQIRTLLNGAFAGIGIVRNFLKEPEQKTAAPIRRGPRNPEIPTSTEALDSLDSSRDFENFI